MEIGVKFCGGCNSRYDRGAQLSKLKEELKDVIWVNTMENPICDYWLAICGCSRECLDTSELVARKKVLILERPIDFQEAKETILSAKEKVQDGKRKILHIKETASMEQKITQELIQAFAALTSDYNPMHTDAAFAATQWFQKPVLHGMFLSSFLSSVMGMKLPGAGTILLEEETKFLKPAFVGNTITATITLEDYEEERIYYIGTFQGICTNQDGEVVTKMTAKQMMMKNIFEIKGDEQ